MGSPLTRNRTISFLLLLTVSVFFGLRAAQIDPFFTSLPLPPTLPSALTQTNSGSNPLLPPRPHRVRLLFTLLNAESSGERGARRWDFGALEALFLTPRLASLASLATFEVRSQTLHHYDSSRAFAANGTEAGGGVANALRVALEERAHADVVGASAFAGEVVYNFIVAVPPADVQPRALDASATSGAIARYGAVVVLNTLCADPFARPPFAAAQCAVAGSGGPPVALSADEAAFVASSLGAQLDALPLFRSTSVEETVEGTRSSLLKRALGEHVRAAHARLSAVQARHSELRGAVGAHVVEAYARASALLARAIAGEGGDAESAGSLAERVVLARRANAAACEAGEGAEWVGESRIELAHLAAIFCPLLLPLLAPVLRSVKQEVRGGRA